MPGKVPDRPKIFHIVHVDRLHSIFEEGYLLSDSEVKRRSIQGTTIGSPEMKAARLLKPLRTYPDLHVGECVPFNFCPRSVLLYLNWKKRLGSATGQAVPANQDGEDKIVHIQADLYSVVASADNKNVRWVFTPVNAAIALAQDFADRAQLHQLDWDAIGSNWWQGKMDLKAAEFLVETNFPTHLIERFGVKSEIVKLDVESMLKRHDLKTPVVVERDWYYDD